MAKYLFQRPGSTNWWIKLRHGGKRVERSLGTSDYREAEEVAHRGFTLDDGTVVSIGAHKAALLAARPRLTKLWDHILEPGREHAGPDGTKIIATEKDLIHIGHNGSIIKTEPNGGFRSHVDFKGGPITNARFEAALTSRPTPAKRKVETDDDAIFETYLKHASVTGYREKEARRMWEIFKQVVNKPIKECNRDDGRAIVKHLEDEADGEAKSATLRRRMVPLVAAVNLAINDGLLTFNPFEGCVPNREDEEERDAFDENDMKVIKANLHKLEPNDRLLLVLLATTGMRRGECFEIDREQVEDGIRYCTIGTKTAASLRRIPFPKDALKYLPDKITKPLLTGRQDSATKRIRAFLEDIKIINETDGRDLAPMHSFRHRAKNRLRDTVEDAELRDYIGGWTTGKKNAGRKYGMKHGKGYSIKKLKAAIDKIGL